MGPTFSSPLADRSVRRRLAVLSGLVGVGALLRLHGLAADPLYGDEAEYAIVARGLARDWLDLSYPQLVAMDPRPFVSQPPLLLYAMALAMRALGPTDLAAALPSALLGIATIPVAYALGARLAGPRAGVVAALILALHPFHVEMSRQAMLDAGFVLFAMLATLLLARWLDARRAPDLLGASAAASLAALSKLPGVVACAAVALVVLGALVAQLARGRRANAARDARHALLALAPPALAASAYAALLARIGALDDLVAKLAWQAERIAGAPSSDPLRVSRPLSYYLVDPHASAPALLGGAVLVVALAGLALLAWRGRRGRTEDAAAVALAAIIAAFATFLAASGRKEGFYLLPLAPMSAILAGACAALAPPLLAARRADALAGARVAALALLVVPAYASAAEAYERFGPGADPLEPRMGAGFRDAARALDAHGEAGGAYGTVLGRFSLQWYAPRATYHWYVGADALDRAAETGALRYVVLDAYLDLPHERETAARLIERHGGELIARLPEAAPRIDVYVLRPEAAAA